MINRLQHLIHEETYGLDLRWQLAKFLMLPIPRYTGGRMRAQVLRSMGFVIGRGTLLWDTPLLVGVKNLHTKIRMGENCLVSIGTYWDLAGSILIGNHVGISPGSMFLTGTHNIGNWNNRVGQMEPRPILVSNGVWLGARCTVMPGVTIGEGAVIGAGALVTRDVPAHTVVVGVPARVIRELPHSN
jgi:maltose O-acetyltransferase